MVAALNDVAANLAEVRGKGLAAHVGRGAHQGPVEEVDEAATEAILYHADGHRAVGGFAHVGQVAGLVVDDGEGAQVVQQQRLDARMYLAHVAFEHLHAIYQQHEGLVERAILEGIDVAHGGGVGGIATEAPDGVGREEEQAAPAQCVQRGGDVGVVLHHGGLPFGK